MCIYIIQECLKKQENYPAFDFTQTGFLHDSAAFLCMLMEHISVQYLLFANMWFLVINLSFISHDKIHLMSITLIFIGIFSLVSLINGNIIR